MTSSSPQQQDSVQFGFGHDAGCTKSSKRSSSYSESPFSLFSSRILRKNMAKNCRRQTEVCVCGEEARDHHNYICAKLVGTAYKVSFFPQSICHHHRLYLVLGLRCSCRFVLWARCTITMHSIGGFSKRLLKPVFLVLALNRKRSSDSFFSMDGRISLSQ